MPYNMYLTDSSVMVLLFPVTPSKITLKINNQNKTLTLINEGERNLVKSPGLTDIEIDELLLPNVQYPFGSYPDGFHAASYYLEFLDKWKNSGEVIGFTITRTSPDNSKLLADTNMEVTVEDYEIIEDAEKYGLDTAVKLKLKQYHTWGAKKLVIKTDENTTPKVTPAPAAPAADPSKPKEKDYTVKKGDCLIKIARAQLGSDSRWKEIYNLNKDLIEKTAQKHGRKSSSNGHWIYPGTVLKLPS